jgi:hypothetical protein
MDIRLPAGELTLISLGSNDRLLACEGVFEERGRGALRGDSAGRRELTCGGVFGRSVVRDGRVGCVDPDMRLGGGL